MNNQLTIFDIMYPKYKITKPIRLIELFGGYGSQALALKYLGVDYEHWKLCEWAVKSIQAYKDIHFENDNTDYSKDYSIQDIIAQLYFYGISSNYNEPMTLEQIKRLSETQQRKIFNNIKTTHNLVNIQTTHAIDLKIVDTDKYEYIMTYSFPCQDLSLAGKGKGMSDTSTRSGLLWEVERILTECKKLGTMPQILLMENVPQVHSLDNMPDFHKWQVRLEELGYKSYWQDLIATNFGIPQTRNRCFMVSIFGDYSYTFPKPIPLKLKLKDMLEDNVDKKYYLSDKQIKDIESWNAYEKPLETLDKEVSKTLTTRSGDYTSGMQLVKDNIKKEIGICIGTYQYAKSDNFMQGKDRLQLGKEVSDTLQTTQKEGIVNNNLRIRKLTPKECFRLMGVKDEDFDRVSKNQSDSSLYHLAGDSICITVLMAIFSQLLDIEWSDKLWNIKNFI